MKRDDIIRMAREAGLVLGYPFMPEHLERFAALVAAAEREACARVCDEMYQRHFWGAQDCAAAIRSRGES